MWRGQREQKGPAAQPAAAAAMSSDAPEALALSG